MNFGIATSLFAVAFFAQTISTVAQTYPPPVQAAIEEMKASCHPALADKDLQSGSIFYLSERDAGRPSYIIRFDSPCADGSQPFCDMRRGGCKQEVFGLVDGSYQKVFEGFATIIQFDQYEGKPFLAVLLSPQDNDFAGVGCGRCLFAAVWNGTAFVLKDKDELKPYIDAYEYEHRTF